MDTLPPEVLTLILGFLPHATRKMLAMMNKTLYYASIHPTLLRKEFLVYKEQTSDYDDECLNRYENVLMKTDRSLLQLKLHGLSYHDTLFENCGDRITYLYLDYMYIGSKLLDALATYCQNLKKLKLKLRQSDVSPSFLEPCKPIPKLRTITFDDVAMCDEDYSVIIQSAPNLEFLNLYQGEKLDPYYYCVNFVGETMTDAIVNSLKAAKKIKGLKLDFYYFYVFYELPEDIKLNSLLLRLEYDFRHLIELLDVEVEDFKSKLAKQTSLKKLIITCMPCCFLPAISKLCNLNYLSLTNIIHARSDCIDKDVCLQTFHDSLVNLKNLKTLHIDN